MRRRDLVLALGAASLAGVGVSALVISGGGRFSRAGASVATGRPAVGGPFTLMDTRRQAVTERDLLGKPSLMYFGFTYCPEVCPTTLGSITAWLKALGPGADRLNVVFVSIDPERDTPEQLGLYLSSFDRRIRGLTGTPTQVAEAARQYRIYYQKVPLDGGGYTMDHSTGVYLMDRRGHLADVIAYQEPADRALAKLRALIRG